MILPMTLDNLEDAKSARQLKTEGLIARALIEAKLDGIAEAISQISQANADGQNQKLASVHAALQRRREFLATQMANLPKTGI
jgi:hypothetical protein